jgi:hypothetical protein
MESCIVAVATDFWPIRTAEGFIATTTVATGAGGGAITDILAAPETPSLTALTTAVPGAIAETTPESVTLATDVLEVDHVIGRPDSATPFASLGVATARAV